MAGANLGRQVKGHERMEKVGDGAHIRSARVGRAELFAVLAAVLFSTGGAGIKAGAFSALQVSAVRSGIAWLALLVWQRGRVQWSPAIGLAGLAYAATLTLFVTATKLTTSANAIFLQSTAPLYLLLLGPRVLDERFRRKDLAPLLMVAAGLVLCFVGRPVPTTTAPNPALGNALGVLCSVVWALTLVALRRLERGADQAGSSMSAVVVGNALASALAFPFAWPLPAASTAEWATLVYLGVGQIALAYAFLSIAIRHLTALEVSLLLLIEPVLNPVWTWLLRGEEPGRWTIAGGTLILVATGAKAVFDGRAQHSVTV